MDSSQSDINSVQKKPSKRLFTKRNLLIGGGLIIITILIVILGTILLTKAQQKKELNTNRNINNQGATYTPTPIPLSEFPVTIDQTGNSIYVSWDRPIQAYTIRIFDTTKKPEKVIFTLNPQPIGKIVVYSTATPAPNITTTLPTPLYPKTFLPNPYLLGTIPSGYYNNATQSSSIEARSLDQMLTKGNTYRVEITSILEDKQVKKGIYTFTYN